MFSKFSKAVLLGLFVFFSFSNLCQAQAPTDIYLFDVDVSKGKIVLSNAMNITNRLGYDNQPAFHPSLPYIYYASVDEEGQSDIKYYNYQNQSTHLFTNSTKNSEYSPMVTPDGNFISCVYTTQEGKQHLVKYPIQGGEPIILIDDLVIGFYSWMTEEDLLLFVINHAKQFETHAYNLVKAETINLGMRPGYGFTKVPSKPASSVVAVDGPYAGSIVMFDKNNLESQKVTKAIGKQELFTWTHQGFLLMADGNQLFYKKEDQMDGGWIQVELPSSFKNSKNIGRIAVNSDHTKLVLVVDE